MGRGGEGKGRRSREQCGMDRGGEGEGSSHPVQRSAATQHRPRQPLVLLELTSGMQARMGEERVTRLCLRLPGIQPYCSPKPTQYPYPTCSPHSPQGPAHLPTRDPGLGGEPWLEKL